MASVLGVGHKECCDCYRGRCEDHQRCCGGYRGWLRTTNWLFVETWLGGGYTKCCDATGVC